MDVHSYALLVIRAVRTNEQLDWHIATVDSK